MTKVINRFDPVTARTFEEAERHYVEVHHPFARRMHREGDRVTQYVINRALAQYDINGEFCRKPEAWRYVLQRRRDDLTDAQSFLPEWARESIWNDHINCLRNIRSLEVEANEVLDRCSGQMAFVKYLFEFHAPAGATPDAEAYYAREHLPRLRELADSAFGFRRLITNKVLRQAVAAPLREPGQVLTGEWQEPQSVYRIEEYWFDNAAWGADFFRGEDVRQLLQAAALGTTEGYLVEERCGVDKS